MRRLLAAIALSAAVGPSSAQVPPPQPSTPPSAPKMTAYQLVILKKGPNAAAASSPESQGTLKGHVDSLYRKAAAGLYVAAGPFTDSGEIQGIVFAVAATPERAIEMESDDPAVQAGIFTVEALPFLSPEGHFSGKWAEFGKFERVFFGFLNNGPDRTQDAATAERLQREHLAYMDGQAKLGKLVVAGPFMVSGGTRRGIVVYRVDTPEEARERANGDPMVKAGRLAVELHPWQVPVGALPTPK